MESSNGKNTMTEIRNLLHRSKGGLDGAGERISELENRLVGST